MSRNRKHGKTITYSWWDRGVNIRIDLHQGGMCNWTLRTRTLGEYKHIKAGFALSAEQAERDAEQAVTIQTGTRPEERTVAPGPKRYHR